MGVPLLVDCVRQYLADGKWTSAKRMARLCGADVVRTEDVLKFLAKRGEVTVSARHDRRARLPIPFNIYLSTKKASREHTSVSRSRRKKHPAA